MSPDVKGKQGPLGLGGLATWNAGAESRPVGPAVAAAQQPRDGGKADWESNLSGQGPGPPENEVGLLSGGSQGPVAPPAPPGRLKHRVSPHRTVPDLPPANWEASGSDFENPFQSLASPSDGVAS